jgi:hypothetical protein
MSMSLFARLFRKAPPAPAARTPESTTAAAAEKAQVEQAVRAEKAARDEDTLQVALAGGDTAVLLKLVVEGSSTRVRQQAAGAIQDVEQLRQLIKEVRGKDNSVYRILQAKREELLAMQRREEQQQAEVLAVTSALERHSQRPFDALFAPTLEQLAGRWQVAARHASPDAIQKAQVALERGRAVISDHETRAAEAAQREAQAARAADEARRQREAAQQAAAAEAAEQAQVRQEQQREESAQKEAEAAALRQIAGLIRKAQGALNAGGTSRAAGVRRSLEDKLATAAPLPAYLTTQLQALDKRLNEMKDWRSFSVAPKRIELMESMEALVGADLPPQELADRIKGLQEEWRTLSRGAAENVEEEWQRFHAAAQKAYEPCRAHFAAQAQSRQENLRKREQLVEQLAAFESAHNWDQPEWRTVMTALREAKEEWRQASPVERAAGAAVKERFQALTGILQQRLDAEYDRNVQKKRTLIAAAERLRAEDDSRRATDEIKDIQRRWKEVGPVPRALDQALWEELRQYCDAVFEKRQRGQAEQAAGLEARRTAAVAAAEELEQIAALSGPELLEKAQLLPERRAAFEAIGELPRQHARELQRRFERATEQVEQAVAMQRAEDAERSWTDLLDAASRVRAYRAALASGAPAAEAAELKASAEIFIAGVGRWPRGGLEALKRELAREDAGDAAAGESALRQLVIQAEVLTDLPTPAEDQALRRDYQVRRLMEGMGQGLIARDGEIDELALAWVGAGPAEGAADQALLERFKRCRREQLARAVS